MLKNRANSSLIAVLVILLVIAGVIYLFWQNSLEPAPENLDTTVVEETVTVEVTTEADEVVTEVVEEDVITDEEPVAEETTEE